MEASSTMKMLGFFMWLLGGGDLDPFTHTLLTELCPSLWAVLMFLKTKRVLFIRYTSLTPLSEDRHDLTDVRNDLRTCYCYWHCLISQDAPRDGEIPPLALHYLLWVQDPRMSELDPVTTYIADARSWVEGLPCSSFILKRKILLCKWQMSCIVGNVPK